MSVNISVLMGRITDNPKLRTTQSGISVTRFTIAVDRNYTPKGEEKKTDFINIIAWRSTAEFVTKYFKKGSMIAVQGAIETGSYEKDGVKRYTFEINAENVSFCGSKAEGNNTPAGNENTPQGANFTPSGADVAFTELTPDDDLPF